MLELDTSGRGYLDIYDDLNLDAISD
jgi:hypothetical protein